jgi:hypothetical protein
MAARQTRVLSIGEAIQAFSKFTETVFKDSGGLEKALKEGHMFELARLEKAVDTLLGERANDLIFESELALSRQVNASIKDLRSLTPEQWTASWMPLSHKRLLSISLRPSLCENQRSHQGPVERVLVASLHRRGDPGMAAAADLVASG